MSRATRVAVTLSWLVPAAGAAQEVTVRVTNHVPQFMAFHEAVLDSMARAAPEPVRGTGSDPAPTHAELRWTLWQHTYAFPPLPGDEGGQAAVRRRLEAAWPRYESAVPRIRSSVGAFRPAPEPILRDVADALGLDGRLELHLIVHVGMFDRPARFSLEENEYRVPFPVELASTDAERHMLLVHAFAEAVHARRSGRPTDRDPTLAEALLARGLGLRVYEALTPELSPERYLGRPIEWLLEAERRDRLILQGLREHLGERDPGIVERFRTGSGATGLEGELDYAGWRLVGHLFLRRGWTPERLSEVPAADVFALMAETIDSVLP